MARVKTHLRSSLSPSWQGRSLCSRKIKPLSWSALAPITKYRRPAAYTMDIYFSQLRFWKPKTKVETGSLSGLQLSVFLLYPHVLERASSGLFFFYEAPLPRPHLSLTTSYWLHLITITLRVGLQPMKLQGPHVQSRTASFGSAVPLHLAPGPCGVAAVHTAS